MASAPHLRASRVLLGILVVALLSLNVFASEGNWTAKHETGRCAIRGQCGKQSFFGSELPCPDNGLAQDPDEDTRKKLVDICGDSWSDGAVCCDEDQVGRLIVAYIRTNGADLNRSTT